MEAGLSRTRLAYGAIGLAIFGWASLHPVAKEVVPRVGAVQVAVDRATIAFLALSLLTVARRGPRQLLSELRNDPAGIALFALLSFTVSSLLALAALRWLPAGVNAVLNNMGPLWLALGAAFAGHARRRSLLAVGAAVAFAGVVLVVVPGSGEVGTLDWRGVALSASSSFVIAAQAVYGRKLLPGRDPIAVTAIAAGMGALALACLLPFAGGLQPVLAASGPTRLWLLYLGLGATSLNFACWSYALQHLPATRAMNLQNLIPPLGVLLSVLFLGEPLTRWLAAGVLVIIAGTWLAQTGAAPAQAPGSRSVAPVVRQVRPVESDGHAGARP